MRSPLPLFSLQCLSPLKAWLLSIQFVSFLLHFAALFLHWGCLFIKNRQRVSPWHLKASRRSKRFLDSPWHLFNREEKPGLRTCSIHLGITSCRSKLLHKQPRWLLLPNACLPKVFPVVLKGQWFSIPLRTYLILACVPVYVHVSLHTCVTPHMPLVVIISPAKPRACFCPHVSL